MLLAEWDDEYGRGRKNISSYLLPAAFTVERRNVMTAAYNEVESDESEREGKRAVKIFTFETFEQNLRYGRDCVGISTNRIWKLLMGGVKERRLVRFRRLC